MFIVNIGHSILSVICCNDIMIEKVIGVSMDSLSTSLHKDINFEGESE